jgi:folate-binding protein YgfZ
MSEPRLFTALLTDRALIRVAGADARSFLQGLLTQDVETLAEGELRYGALLTPQGRLIYDLFLLCEVEGVLLDVASGARDDLVQRLTLYRLRAKVRIEPVNGTPLACWGEGDPGQGWLADPRLRALGWRRYDGSDAAKGQPGDYDAHRLSLGVVDPARDAPDSDLYPIEANLDLLNGIDFKKGCFVGQETTSRMKRRGQIKSRIVPLRFDGAAPAFGAEVLSGELRAGEVRSSAAGRALALIRLDRAALGNLTVEGRAVRLDPPDWMDDPVAMKRLEPEASSLG